MLFKTKFLELHFSNKLSFMFLILPFLMCSCVGPKTMNKWVAKQYGNTVNAPTKNDYIKLNSTVNAVSSELSTAVGKTSNVLPLIVYWHLIYRNTCTLNPQIPINNVAKTLFADKQLKQQLNGQRLELSIDKIPTTFTFEDRANLIFLVYAFGWDYLSITPEKTDLVVSYKLLKNDNSIVKTGTINIPNTDKGISMGMFQSTKNRTLQYLTEYNESIVQMTKQFIEKLVKEF